MDAADLNARLEPTYVDGIDDNVDITAAMAQLELPERTAVLLVDLHGFTYEAAAEIMNIPAGTLPGHIRRGRTHLRALLDIAEEVEK